MHSTPPARAPFARAAVGVWAAARVAPAAALTALCAAGATAGAQTVRDLSDEMIRPEVREVRIVGTRALARDDVADALATKASGCLSLVFRPFCLFTRSPYVYERRYLDREEFQRDVVRLLVFYYKRGWRDAQVDTAVTRAGANAVRVTFTVREGAPTRTAAVTVDDPTNTLRPRERQRLLVPTTGEPFNTLRLDSAVVRVRDAYWDRGYGNAVVERPTIAVDDSANTAAARIPVAPGPLTTIGQIDIVHLGSAPQVKDETIRHALTVRPGELFRRTEVARSQRRLYESGLFRSALIDTAVAREPAEGRTVCASQAAGAVVGQPAASAPASAAAAAAPDSVKNLVVCVLEAPLREARTSVGFTTADFLQVEGRYTHNYFLGGARRANVQATIGNLGSRGFYQVLPQNVFQNPFRQVTGGTEAQFFLPTYYVGFDVQQRDVFSPRNTLGFGVFGSRRQSPGVFLDQGQGANVAATRRFGEGTPVSLAYRFEVNRVRAGDVYFCVNFGVCDQPTIAAVSRARRLAPLALTASTSRVDNPLSPTRGLLGRVEFEHASGLTFSNFRYNRAVAELSYYRPAPVMSRVVLAGRVRSGFVRALGGGGRSAGGGGTDVELLHPRTRFYAGGAQSVRGYGENQLGPRVLTLPPNQIRNYDSVGTRVVPLGGCAGSDRTSLLECFGNRQTTRRFEVDPGSTDSSLAYPFDDTFFTPRPLGGTALVEANLEARFPVWRQLFGAVFVDMGVLGEGSLRDVSSGTRAVTPGFGVRYRTPVGPVRVDLGIRPRLQETLPVITQTTDAENGRNLLVDLTSGQSCEGGGAAGCRRFPQQNVTGLRGAVRRLVLHLSIGEAF
jgi:outer membrane protein assembly factor BamA